MFRLTIAALFVGMLLVGCSGGKQEEAVTATVAAAHSAATIQAAVEATLGAIPTATPLPAPVASDLPTAAPAATETQAPAASAVPTEAALKPTAVVVVRVAPPPAPKSVAAVTVTSGPLSPATGLALRYRCRQYCFMVPMGKGQAALTSLGELATGSPLTLLKAAKDLAAGNVLRVESNTTVEFVQDGPIGPYIRPLSGKHAGEVGQTLSKMLATLS